MSRCNRSLHAFLSVAARVLGLASVCLGAAGTVLAADDDFVTAVQTTHPLAYYRLDAVSGASLVGSGQYHAVGGVATAAPGAPLGAVSGKFAQFNGRDASIVTTQTGGIGAGGSIMAWVNLAALPSDEHRVLYVAGESQSGNDFDLQFEPDNQLRFYTAAGSHTSFAPPAGSLVNQWHFIVATMDTKSQVRAIYWDGKPVATDTGGSAPNKKSVFTIGESTVFTGRFFKGGIEDVAIWARALSATEVAALYARSAPATAPAGAPVATTSAPSAAPGTGPFATTATVTAEDSAGPIVLKREEQIALMFMSSIQNLESNCQLRAKAACDMNQLLAGGPASDGSKLGHLKFDPAVDPNYAYTLSASGMAWEAHATAKKPGLAGYYFYSKGIGIPDAHYNPSGSAGAIDKQLTSRGVMGDSFDTR